MTPVVDVGLAQLGGVIEELRDEQVLPFGGELDEAVGPGAGQTGLVELVQRVVLLLDETTHRVERLLVLQSPVEQFPAQLVPAVGAQVGAGIKLAEQPGIGVAVHLDAERCRPCRSGQAERLHVVDHDTELVLEGPADGLAPGPADVEVGGPAPPVADREHLARSEHPKAQQPNGYCDHAAHQHIGRCGHAQMHLGDGHQHHQRRGHPLPDPAPTTLGDQAVEDPEHDHDQRRRLFRRQRPPVPIGTQGHPKRPGPTQHRRQQVLDDHALQDPGDQHHHQLAQPAKHQQGQHQPPQQHVDGHPRARRRQHPHRRRQTGHPQPGQPPDHCVIDHRDRHRPVAQTPGEQQQRQRHRHHRRGQPPHPRGLQRAWQRRRLPRRTAPAGRTPDLGPAQLNPRARRSSRLACGDTHDASQPHRRRTHNQAPCRSPNARLPPGADQHKHPTPVRRTPRSVRHLEMRSFPERARGTDRERPRR